MSSCYKTSNNKYFNLPPRMDDARHFTDYRPNGVVDNNIKKENKILNSQDYRLFLIENAKKIMDVNRKLSHIHNGLYECNKDNESTMLPEKDKLDCNINSCEVVHNYDDGIGIGRMHTELSECLQSVEGTDFDVKDNVCLTNNNINK